jgi:hypothetical protein
MRLSLCSLEASLGALSVISMFAVAGCGGSRSYTTPPIVLSVSLSSIVNLQQGGTANASVIIDAPTETASFSITGLPPGVSQSYKESESNPSGLLTLTANASASIGTYMPKRTVGSSGQTASTLFTLVVTAPAKGSTP